MSEPIIYIDRSRVRPGHQSALRAAITDLARFIESAEPQLLAYGIHLDEAGQRMSVTAVHPDTNSAETHLTVGGEAFRKLAEHLELESIEVYGEATARMRELLQQKADALGHDCSVLVTPRYAGFARLPRMQSMG